MAAYNAQLASGWDLNLNAAVFNAKNQQVGAPLAIPYGSFGGNIASGPGQIARLVGAIDAVTVPANYPGNTLGVPAWVIGSLTPGQGYTTDFDTTSTRLVAASVESLMGVPPRDLAARRLREAAADRPRSHLQPPDVRVSIRTMEGCYEPS